MWRPSYGNEEFATLADDALLHKLGMALGVFQNHLKTSLNFENFVSNTISFQLSCFKSLHS